jgi:hypothetical protein
MRFRPLLLGLLALPGCARADDRPAAAAGAVLPGPVSYEVRSWGRLLLRWQVNPDGSGEIWRQAGHKGSAELRKFRLRLEGDALRAFVADVEEARLLTRGGIDCKKDVFDLPYGTVVWDYPGARQTYAFDAGCRSEKADQAVEILGAADTVVETLAKIDANPYIVEPER